MWLSGGASHVWYSLASVPRVALWRAGGNPRYPRKCTSFPLQANGITPVLPMTGRVTGQGRRGQGQESTLGKILRVLGCGCPVPCRPTA